jgi:hypothetical protein
MIIVHFARVNFIVIPRGFSSALADGLREESAQNRPLKRTLRTRHSNNSFALRK